MNSALQAMVLYFSGVGTGFAFGCAWALLHYRGRGCRGGRRGRG